MQKGCSTCELQYYMTLSSTCLVFRHEQRGTVLGILLQLERLLGLAQSLQHTPRHDCTRSTVQKLCVDHASQIEDPGVCIRKCCIGV